jgi:hypothetical protein
MKYLLAFLLMIGMTYADPLPIKNPVPKQPLTMTRQEVLFIYSMKTRFWEDGTKITVYYLDRDSAIHKAFVRKVLGITPEKFDSMLDTYLNSGNAGSFRMARNEQSVMYSVGLIEGSVGYIDEDTLVISGGGYVAKVKITN